ncbi:cation-translocating P-type ATPase [Candidatus Bipolaricaulota bacterium]
MRILVEGRKEIRFMPDPRTSSQTSDSFFALSVVDVLDRLGTSQEAGLSHQEAGDRLEAHGLNELRSKKTPSLFFTILRQLRSFLIFILIAAVIISMLVGEWVEAIVILAIVLLNAIVGALQERKAEQALQSLKELAAPDARVLREGDIQVIPAKHLIPGDIVFLEAGSMVPADLRLVESSRLQVEEASLTGESAPATKDASITLATDAPLADRANCAFAGTRVTYGRGVGVVMATGHDTQVGHIATLLEEEEDAPPLQRKLEAFGRVMGISVLAICGLLFLVGLLRSTELSTLFSQGFVAFWSSQRQTIIGLFVVAVSLAVAAVPEGLPAVVTMTLALGTQKMLRRNTLVRRLPSVETLGSATVICTDKTGTLTQNKMTVTHFWTSSGQYVLARDAGARDGAILLRDQPISIDDHPELRKALVLGFSCNDAEVTPGGENPFIGDPTEGALLLAAKRAGLDPSRKPARITEIPFDSQRKRMTTIHAVNQLPGFEGTDSGCTALIKGAVDGMLPLCTHIEMPGGASSLAEDQLEEIQTINDEMGKSGLRVLALAYRLLDHVGDEPSAEDIETELTFLGLVAMQDPPRLEVADAVGKASAAGLRTIMITGDHAATATAIARQIGILRPEGLVVEGAVLETMNDDALFAQIKDIDVFARVSPQHKVRIVEALKSDGHIVAMTGDGVNDAPALKKADIGIAMGITGTDVAKDSADMVLVDDNYASIISAIEQGRVIYDNIRKAVFYLLTCNFAEIAILFIATLLGWPAPLTAIQLLWLNLVTDGAPALALALEPEEPGIMKRPPRPTNEPIIDRRMLRGFLVQSSALAGSILGVFWLALQGIFSAVAGTMAFATLVLAELFRAYSVRSEDTPILKLGWRSNRWMQMAVATSAVLLLVVLYIPPLARMFEVQFLRLAPWGLILPFALIPMLATESRKVIQRIWRRRMQA